MKLKLIALILKFLMQFLPQLGEQMDADSQKKWEEYNARRTQLETDEKQTEFEISESEKRISQLSAEREAAQQAEIDLTIEIAQIYDRQRRLENEKSEKLARLNELSDDDVLRGDVFAATDSGTGDTKTSN